ncbi:acyl-CoA N-acyltransferase [Aureobasidium subglaciale]|nr:acyl-CoA N-acyltransferase [Aureobasidium subglaciale]
MTTQIQEPITTERLILRQLQPSDSDALFEFMSLPSVMQYTRSTRAPLTEPHQASTYLSERISGPNIYNFAVCLANPSKTLIGILGSPSYPEIGYLFSPSHAGKGYATEALLAFVPALFAIMPEGQKFAEALVDTENMASIKLLQRCGWKQWGGVQQGDYTSPLLGVRDSVCYRIAREGCELEDTVVEGEDEERAFVPDLQ